MASGANDRLECVERSCQAFPDEARAETHRDVVAVPELDLAGVRELEADAIGDPCRIGPVEGGRVELRPQLHAANRAAELPCEQHGGSSSPRRDVEHSRTGTEPQALAEEQECLA
jgi:hypothetical protein